MRSTLLAAFGIDEATDTLCSLASLPMIDWDAEMTDETINEIGLDCVECSGEANNGSKYCLAC